MTQNDPAPSTGGWSVGHQPTLSMYRVSTAGFPGGPRGYRAVELHCACGIRRSPRKIEKSQMRKRANENKTGSP
eukprot:700182-Pyramimonas_sp.AAC.1